MVDVISLGYHRDKLRLSTLLEVGLYLSEKRDTRTPPNSDDA